MPERLGSAVVRGVEDVNRGVLGAVEAAGEGVAAAGQRAQEEGFAFARPLFELVEQAGSELAQLGRQSVPEETAFSKPAGESGSLPEDIAQALPSFATGIGAGLVGGPGVAMAVLGAQETGGQYLRERQDGKPHEEAVQSAVTYGVASALLERYGVSKVLENAFPGAARGKALDFAKRYVRASLAEGGTEATQDVASNLTTVLTEASRRGMDFDALADVFSEENLRQYGRTALVSSILGGGTVAAGALAPGQTESTPVDSTRSQGASTPTPPSAASGSSTPPEAAPEGGTFSPSVTPPPSPEAAPSPGTPLPGEGVAVPEVPSHAGQSGESPEAIARVSRGERTFRVTRSGDVLPILNTVDAVDVRVNPGEAKVRLTAGGDFDIEQGGQGTVAQRAAISRLREGRVPELAETLLPTEERQPLTFELDVGEGLPSEAPVQGGFGEAGFAQVATPAQPLPPRFEFEDKATEKRFQEALKGVPQPGIWTRVRESMRHAGEVFAREHPLLPHGAFYAPAREALRRVSNAPGVSVQRAGTALSEDLRGLKDEDYDLFLRHSLVENLQGVRETYGAETEIGFGFTDETLGAEAARLQQAISANPRVARAVEKTRATWNAIRDETREAFAAANLPTDFLDRQGDRYLHHQILEYAALDVPGVSGKLKAPTGRGFQRALTGSEKDFNLRYAQAQGRVMAQLLADAETARQLVQIRKTYSDPVKAQARAAAKAAGEARSWREYIPEDHALWQPREGNVFFTAQTLSDRLAKQIITEGLAEVAPEDLRQMLAKGGRREEYVLPKALVETLETSGAKIENDILRRLVRSNEKLQRGWKVWQLLSPRRWFKYTGRNLVGDAAATLQGNPGTFRPTNLGTAAKELATVIFGKQRSPSPEMESWILRGGLEAGLSQQEIETSEAERIQRLIESPGFVNALKDLARSPQKVGRMYWSAVRKNAKFFESILRYATYRDYLSQVRASPEGRPKNYGASIKSEVDAMESPEDKAYRLSNELVGAYDQVSAGGQFLRREAVPFWSFQEINVRRHWRLLKNALRDERLAGAMAKRAGITVVRQGAMLPLRAGKFLALAYGLEAFLHAWNYLLFPDEEDDLSENVKRQPHIILGRRDNGEILYFNRLGVFQDFREWFGIDEFGEGVVEYLNGRKTAKDVAKDMVTPIVDKAVNSIGGLGLAGSLKLLTEVLTRSSTFPSATKPRRITDVPDYLARSFAVESEFRAVSGRPMRTGGKSGAERWARSIPEMFLYSQDPGSSAYYDALGLRDRYLRSTGEEKGGYGWSSRSHALRNFKQALRYDEPDLAKKYLFEYALLGGTPDGLSQSLDRLDPFYGLSDDEYDGFMAWLDDEEKATVETGRKYYESVLRRSEALPFDADEVFAAGEMARE